MRESLLYLFLLVLAMPLPSTLLAMTQPPTPLCGCCCAEEDTWGGMSGGGPWLTGPLLSPSANTIPRGHIDVEPYLFANNNLGSYDGQWHLHKFPEASHNINLLILLQMGLSEKVDFSIIPQGFYSWVGDVESFRFGDLWTSLGFQLMKEDREGWKPGIKFSLGENFPTGSYQDLDPAKLGTDSSGSGSFATSFRLTFSKVFRFWEDHYLATRFAVWSTLFTPVRVHGFNSYGGNRRTDGTVHPGTLFAAIFGLEYTLTCHWALALDILASYSDKSTFHSNIKGAFAPSGSSSFSGGKGHFVLNTTTFGILEDDFLAPVGNPNPSFSFSLAPALEYNFSKNYGLIMGVWFTVFGKNSISFINGVVAFNFFL